MALAAASAALILSLAACSPAADTGASATATPEPAQSASADGLCAGDEGVGVIVDAGNLADADTIALEACVFADDTLAVADALQTLGVETEGTVEYGDQALCRVDGLPSADEPLGSTEDPAYIEECASMAPAFGYWALWVKPAGGEWDYAQEGVSTLQLEPGDAVELLFTLDGEPAAPTS
ncbi:hypothetical protein RS81_03214 [Microbacterium terrae]|uniref:DUF4430 domain-containing protein n=1 Tax=Microbacterium terrae TaxID=69369 RepID=A0A0M2H0B8_9MICO|nr:hypothetical protein RS81_03214 [Microbacterium terrae]